MQTFNLLIFLWQISLGISILFMVYGLFKKSWGAMLVSFVTFLPIASYFYGANNGWRLVAFIPVVLLVVSFMFWKNKRMVKS